MTALLALLRARATPYVLAALVVAGWLASYTHHEREIGRQQVLLAVSDSLQRVATAALTRAQRQAVRDSVQAVRLQRVADAASQRAVAAESRLAASVTAYHTTRARLDAALAALPDTTRAVVTTFAQVADSTVRACTDARDALQRALDACQTHGLALTAQLASAQAVIGALATDTTAKAQAARAERLGRPSVVAVWWNRLGWVAAAVSVLVLFARR